MADVGAREMLEVVESGDAAEVDRLFGVDLVLAVVRGVDGVFVILWVRYHGYVWVVERLADVVAEFDLFEVAVLGRVGCLDELVGVDPGVVRSKTADGFT